MWQRHRKCQWSEKRTNKGRDSAIRDRESAYRGCECVVETIRVGGGRAIVLTEVVIGHGEAVRVLLKAVGVLVEAKRVSKEAFRLFDNP